MRIGNLSDRLVLVTDQGAIDVEKSSAGRFGADPQAVYERWHEFREWAATASTDDAAPFRLDELGRLSYLQSTREDISRSAR